MPVILFVASSISFAELREVDLIEAVKNSKASILESGLPDLSIEDWVTKSFEKGSKAKWESNDCGEGWHIDNPKTPVCVEIKIPQENGYVLHTNTIINSEQEIYEPKIWLIYFYKGENYKTIDSFVVESIREAMRLYKTNLGRK